MITILTKMLCLGKKNLNKEKQIFERGTKKKVFEGKNVIKRDIRISERHKVREIQKLYREKQFRGKKVRERKKIRDKKAKEII